MNKQHGTHFINNEWIDGKGDEFYSYNIATNEKIWRGNIATKHEISKAFDAASQALTKWCQLKFSDRAQFAKKFAKIIEQNQQQLATLISIESGKPLWEANTEVKAVINKIDISIRAYEQRTPNQDVTSISAANFIGYKPYGVVAVLGPFNFPAHLSNGHIVPALIAGNTVILKPSDLTPKVSEFISECWQQSGLPKGVFNCIQGDGETAKNLLELNIQGVYFTGSYQTGLKINHQFVNRPSVILALEMGGNNPLVIDKVNDLSAALYTTLLSTMITAGQRCSCARRLIIPNNSFGDKFLNAFIKLCQNIVIGKYDDKPEPFIGPIIRHSHALEHLKAQDKLEQQGANVLLKMQLIAKNSSFLTPGIIDMSNIMQKKTNFKFDDEIFAPFVQVYKYDDFTSAIALANNTEYGLVAGLVSENKDKFIHFYNSVNAGLINWNRPTTGASSDLPFGGIGKSGNNRPSAYFAADYCSYPIASLIEKNLNTPKELLPGIKLDNF